MIPGCSHHGVRQAGRSQQELFTSHGESRGDECILLLCFLTVYSLGLQPSATHSSLITSTNGTKITPTGMSRGPLQVILDPVTLTVNANQSLFALPKTKKSSLAPGPSPKGLCGEKTWETMAQLPLIPSPCSQSLRGVVQGLIFSPAHFCLWPSMHL